MPSLPRVAGPATLGYRGDIRLPDADALESAGCLEYEGKWQIVDSEAGRIRIDANEPEYRCDLRSGAENLD